MSLTLYFHPMSSFCWKSLVALYDAGVPFTPLEINLGEEQSRNQLLRIWPMGQFPVLQDEGAERTIPQSSAIFEYLPLVHAGAKDLFPEEELELLEARRWNDFFDTYVQHPMQKIVGDCLRKKADRDPYGEREAHEMLRKAYGILESHLSDKTWMAGENFSIADCSACPALFYGNKVEPIAGYPNLTAYLQRLQQRSSFARVLKEAEPWQQYFPYPAKDA